MVGYPEWQVTITRRPGSESLIPAPPVKAHASFVFNTPAFKGDEADPVSEYTVDESATSGLSLSFNLTNPEDVAQLGKAIQYALNYAAKLESFTLETLV